MQIGAAFGQVQGSLNWFVDNFGRIAEWRSAVSRIVAFRDLIEELDALMEDPEQPTIGITEGTEDVLSFRNLEVAFANGTTVIADASAEIHAGERVLIQGDEAGGKAARPDGRAYRVDEAHLPGLIGAASEALWESLAMRLNQL